MHGEGGEGTEYFVTRGRVAPRAVCSVLRCESGYRIRSGVYMGTPLQNKASQAYDCDYDCDRDHNDSGPDHPCCSSLGWERVVML